jgi:hypothetical protein
LQAEEVKRISTNEKANDVRLFPLEAKEKPFFKKPNEKFEAVVHTGTGKPRRFVQPSECRLAALTTFRCQKVS